MTIVMSNLFSIITSTLATYIITTRLLGERSGLGPVVFDDHGRAIDPGLGEGLHHHHHVRLEKSAVGRDIEKVGPYLQTGLGET